MINLDFMPSRSLALYLVRLFLTRTFAVLVMLVLVLMTLDLLGESGKILAVPPKRSHSSLGIFLSIVIVVTYHKINQYAEQMGAQGRVNPELALWVPFVVFAALIFWMYHVLAHRPGGQPIGMLEQGFAKVVSMVRKLLPREEMRA